MEFSIAALLANFTDEKLVAPKALEKKLDCNDPLTQAKLQIALDALEKIGILVKDKGRYRRVVEEDVVEAKLRCSSKGFCFAIQDTEGSEDVYIRESHLSTAWNGDRVLVKIIKEGSRRRSPEGEVQLILERANPSVLARVKQVMTPNGRVSYRAVPLDDRLLFELDLISNEIDLENAIDHLVHVEVFRYPLGNNRPLGRVVQILGSDAETANDLDIVCCKHDLPRSFSHSVLTATETAIPKFKKTELKKRLDLRHLLTLTFWQDVPEGIKTDENEIPETASLHPYFENSFTIETLESGDKRIGVHIIDATEYIPPESPIDREARKRGSTVHLGKKIVPIIPEIIIRDRCSLVPQQERITISILLTINAEGEVLEFEIEPSLIQVDRQINYEEAEAILHGHPSDLTPIIQQLSEVSQALRSQRMKRGSFELTLPDSISHYDDEGELGVFVIKATLPVQSMIAELIVLANHAIASHFQALGVPGIYRVQSTPDIEDVIELVKLSTNLGCDLYLENEEEIKSIDFQRFTLEFPNSKHERVLNYLFEDILKPPSYSTSPKPHFGLALETGYLHCTSPLSRYVDLLNLRVLKMIFEEGRDRRTTRVKERVNLHHSSCHDQINWNVLPPEIQHEFESDFAASVVHLSERDRVAHDAEHDLIGLQKTGLMKERIGLVFQGLITGVQSYGFFVELEIDQGEEIVRVEGLVHVSSLKDDWYEFRSRQQTLVGRKNRNQYRLGDHVEVQVKSVDYYRQQIDLVAVSAGSQSFDEPEE
ncbi:MAG: ribonuclease R family protein [Microcoleaceae cyanobacterium]|jgi:ribonuclease R